MPEPFAHYLTASLARIERDVPGTYVILRKSLGTRVLRIEVDRECVSVRDDGKRLCVGEHATTGEAPESTAGPSGAAVTAITRRASIVALVDGKMSLEQAVERGAVDLFGSVDDLLAGLDALIAYLNGAARCPELLGLMGQFRRDSV